MTSQEFAQEYPQIGYVTTVRLLNQHGLGLDTPTVYGRNGGGDPYSTFRSTFGVKDFYHTQAVLDWLGY